MCAQSKRCFRGMDGGRTSVHSGTDFVVMTSVQVEYANVSSTCTVSYGGFHAGDWAGGVGVVHCPPVYLRLW